MAGKDPAFLFYSKDWLEGTAEMTPDEKGVYVDLLAHQHQKGSLPPETKRLAKLAGISESEFLLIWKDLATKFLPNGSGRLVNRKLNGIVSERQDKGWRNKIIGTLASIIRYSGQTYETNAKVKKTFKVDDFLACTDQNLTEQVTEWYKKRLKSIGNANEDANAIETLNQHSIKLISCILSLEHTAKKTDAKMELMATARDLMPGGVPNFMDVIKYPKIEMLKSTEYNGSLHKIIFLLVKDFCNSMGVVRNMSEDVMIEAAGILLEECDNFRLEDYVMMFQMAKRGELFDIRDRIDLQVVTEILDAYWLKRKNAGEKAVVEETRHLDSLGSTFRLNDTVSVTDQKLMNMGSGFSAAMGALKDVLRDKVGDKEERARLRQIEGNRTMTLR